MEFNKQNSKPFEATQFFFKELIRLFKKKKYGHFLFFFRHSFYTSCRFILVTKFLLYQPNW